MIERTINNVDMLINPAAANEIFFSQDFLESENFVSDSVTPSDLCELIAKDTYVPMILTWELLDKCNFSCPFCYIVGHSRYKIVRFSQIKEKIQYLVNNGLLYCTLTGGEALVHKDFQEIYVFLKSQGVLVEVYTNGYNVNNDILELFQKYPPYRIEVSIYGISQQLFSAGTGTVNCDSTIVLENIKALKASGVNVRCKTPFNSTTAKAFPEIQSWCAENNIEHYYSTTIYTAHDGTSLDEFEASFDEMMLMEIKKMREIELNYPGTVILDKPSKIKSCYNCGVRNYGLHINANFELQPCSETHIQECTYDLKLMDISEAIDRFRIFVDKHLNKPIQGCIGCSAGSTCKMCPAIAEPILNSHQEVIEFQIPKGHCDHERKKFDFIINNLAE